VKEVEARQQLDTLRRDEKTQTRALANVNEKVSQFEGRKQKLDEERTNLGEKKTEVSASATPCVNSC
jgi:structural maintenance of chromosome 1